MLLDEDQKNELVMKKKVTTTEDIAEWDYDDYEELVTNEVRARRKKKGIDKVKSWNIWIDRYKGGE